MSLLGNLVAQVARQALDPEDGHRNPINQRIQPRRTGGLGDILGSVLGGQTQQRPNNSAFGRSGANHNGFGMDDILGGLVNSQLGGRGFGNMGGAGGMGAILGSVLGGGMGRSTGRSGMGGGKAMLVAALIPIVLNWIQRNGGLSGALAKVQSMGFGNQAQSWMSTQQENDNLDPMEVDKLFAAEDIQQVVQTTGADENEVRQGLAELLPEVVNQLTPEGGLEKEQEANSEISEILQQISSSLNK